MPSQLNPKNRFKAKVFKALSDPVRIEILEFLREGEKCVCEIVPHTRLIQPVVSRHLKILKECGMLKGRKAGTKRLYSIADRRILQLIDDLTPEFADSLKTRMIEQIA